jgi:glycine/D-amino acid oxidase-like deaminating enzyme
LKKQSRSEPVDNNWEIKTSGFTIPSWFNGIENGLGFSKLSEDIITDVAIIGGGIAGLTTAYLLSREGKNISLLEDGLIASGESSRTTAHLTCALDDRYFNLENRHGQKGSRLAAESHTAAINLIETIVNEENIECDFERLDGFLFLDATDGRKSLDRELEAAHNAGLKDVRMTESPLRYRDIGECICFPYQAQFQPLRYFGGLAKAITSKYGGAIYTETHASELELESGRVSIKTSDGDKVTASSAVIATNAPIVDEVSKIYDKQEAHRTYVIAAKIRKGSIPKALFWDTGNQKSKENIKPYHYVRTQRKEKDEDYDLLIVGGEDHKTGNIKNKKGAEERYQRLENWTRNRFPVEGRLVYRWSGQVMEPLDGLAFIGRNPGSDKGVYIATGDSGNGMTHGTVAGILLTDLILGKSNPWEGLYNPDRKVRDKKDA